ncbi:exocyst subunit [Elasticomyces elasticus]|nr:exocyst subunit [Elasticomyces elasticus]
MSWMRQQNNANVAHTNGYGGLHSRQYNTETSSRDTSADERSRSRDSGAYDRYGPSQYNTVSQRVARPANLERDRRQADNRTRDGDWSSSRSRSRPGAGQEGQGSRQVEEVLRYIQQQWSQMASDSCVPVRVALQLMDSSSLGLADQYDQFQDVNQQLQSALRAIVNEHHQGFNSSIGTFHKIQASIHSSQTRVRQLKHGLIQAKASLRTTKPELKGLATSSQEYDDMLQVLGSM